MAKNKAVYSCNACGYESVNWKGRCPSCQSWNTMEEVSRFVAKEKSNDKTAWLDGMFHDAEPVALEDAPLNKEARYQLSAALSEVNQVLGGGLVKGSLLLLGGEPGVGKSTLLLQLCAHFKEIKKILYICGEESPAQIKLRADRLKLKRPGILLYPEVNLEKIIQTVSKLKPDLILVDSIQTIYSQEISGSVGAVSQIKHVAASFLRLAKAGGAGVILVGHITKDGQIAGPLILEHMVDTVLMFEGDKEQDLRLLRAVKNRFGTANELAVFTMTGDGLLPLSNPGVALLNRRPQGVSGSALTAQIEGARCLLMETQALLNNANPGQAIRMTQGFDRNRLNLLLALLSKQFGLNLFNYDVFVNVIGGLKITEPACDLAIVATVLSSYYDLPLLENSVFIGELGLTGELRQVNRLEQRLKAILQYGCRYIFLPSANKEHIAPDLLPPELTVYFIDHLRELPDICFENKLKPGKKSRKTAE